VSNNDVIRGLHEAILSVAREKLGRTLTDKETTFVTSRGGLIALEMILDTVRSDTAPEIERYLNSD
jgi:hypothetical protein